MDTGLLILRVVVGLLLVGHGSQKLFGWFGGHGLEGVGGFLQGNLRFRRGKPMAAIAGLTEVASGLLLAFGLLTPLAGAGLIGVMIVAAWTVHRRNGLWVMNDGYEYPLVIAVIGASLAFTGAGSVSLDSAFDLDLAGAGWGTAAVAAGLVTGLVTLTAGRTQAGAPTANTTTEQVPAPA